MISRDAQGVAYYLEKYKPFRLLALQESPSCTSQMCDNSLLKMKLKSIDVINFLAFSSTHAREVAFTAADWTARVTTSIATTFVAVEFETHDILSSVTLVNSLSIPNDLKLRGKNGGNLSEAKHWQAAAVYTIPRVRRRGVASDVIRAAVDWARKVAHSQEQDCLVTALVMDTNSKARIWYEKCGFSIYNCRDDAVLVAQYIPCEK